MWPQHIPRLVQDIRYSRTLQDRDIVPDDDNSLAHWARVISNPDRSNAMHRHVLVHKTSPEGAEEPTDVQLAFRLQGFVHKINLKPTGNWT